MNSKKQKGFFSKFLKFLKWFGLSIFILIFLIVTAGVTFYFYISKDLPQLTKIEDYKPPVMAEVYDDQGKKIGEFWTEARILTPIDKVPKRLIEAFVSSEDDRFFKHSGVDPYGILRAFLRNLKAGQVVQGASTITQQVTKALLLSPERTYERKIKEAILATRIEKNLNKEQILYIYLNQIFFGNRAYGIAAAARNYFHKKLDELNLAEMAMIAGLAKAPSRFNPIVDPNRAKDRMYYVLDRMAEEGYITREEAKKAKATPLKVYKAGIDKEFNYKYAPWFVEHVRRALMKKYGTEKLYTSGWKIYTTANLKMNQIGQEAVINGLEGFSRLLGYRGPIQHLEDQAKIDEYIRNTHLELLNEKEPIDYYGDPGLKKTMAKPTPLSTNRIYEAVLTNVEGKDLKIQIGNTTGIIPFKDWSWAKRPARKAEPWKPAIGDVVEIKIKTATKGKKDKTESAAISLSGQFVLYQSPEVESALFSYEPFSGAIKTIIGGKSYRKSEFNRATQALLQPGSAIKPLIYAAALDKGYTPGTIIMDSPIVYEESPGKFWTPRNYGGKYYGPTALRHALVNSRNVVTVRILMDIGTHYVAGFMRKMGLKTPIFKYYSMALGANEVKLEELATAFGTFVTGGIRPETYFISKIIDPNGEIIEEQKPPEKPFFIKYEEVKAKKEKETAATTAQAETKPQPETQPMGKGHGSWEEMGFNEELLTTAEDQTEKDDLLLTEYERKVLYGDYIPEGYTITPKTAMTMISILRDVVRAGTGARARALEKPACGKTGTTNEATDAWFIGFTPSLVTGVWVGFDEERKSLGRGRTGSNTALPIWLAYMKKATENYPTKDFTIPKWVDLSVYEAPIQVVMGVGDAELGDEGVGTGVSTGGPSGTSPSSAEFFAKDLE